MWKLAKKTLPISSYSMYHIWYLGRQILYIHIYIHYIWIYICICMCILIQTLYLMYTYICICIFITYTHVCVHAYICIYVYIIVYVCICKWRFNSNSIGLDFLVYSTWLNSSRICVKIHIGPLNSIFQISNQILSIKSLYHIWYHMAQRVKFTDHIFNGNCHTTTNVKK